MKKTFIHNGSVLYTIYESSNKLKTRFVKSHPENYLSIPIHEKQRLCKELIHTRVLLFGYDNYGLVALPRLKSNRNPRSVNHIDKEGWGILW